MFPERHRRLQTLVISSAERERNGSGMGYLVCEERKRAERKQHQRVGLVGIDDYSFAPRGANRDDESKCTAWCRRLFISRGSAPRVDQTRKER